MSTKPRKPTGSFVNDPSGINLLQMSPRPDLFHLERSPYTMASHNSKTNFIGDSVLPEGPRAVAVTETGEKHSILLEDDILQASTNPFSMVTSQCSQLLTQVPATNSSAKISNASSERGRVPISNKRSKATRRYSNQKARPVFTPRNLEKITPRQYVGSGTGEELRLKSPQFNAQTQTDINTNTSSQTMPSRSYHASASATTHHHHHHPPPIPIPRKFFRESVGDMLDSPRRQPLRILPREKTTIKNFSELRSIASALTLITVVSWLFSTFFELEGILDMFANLLEAIQNWYTRREQPMTKAEMLVQYVRNIWS